MLRSLLCVAMLMAVAVSGQPVARPAPGPVGPGPAGGFATNAPATGGLTQTLGAGAAYGLGVAAPVLAGLGLGSVQQAPVQYGAIGAIGGQQAYTAPVLPQNFQQPQYNTQLQQPVLSPQQLMSVIPTDQLQAALNQRVAAFGQTGAMPIQQQFGGIPQQQFGAGVIPQQQFGAGAIGQQLPLGVGAGVQQWGGIQQQVPFGGVGIQQQPLGAIGVQPQPWMQQPLIGQQQVPFGGAGIQQPIGPQPLGPM